MSETKSSVMVEPNHPQLESVSVLDRIFPHVIPLSKSGANAIIQKHVIFISRQGRGKTNGAAWIVEEAKRRFKEENVNVQVAKGEDFRKVLDSGCWTNQLVQIIVLEDITYVDFSDEDLAVFFRIREVMATKSNRLDGLVLVIFTGHKFHNTPDAFREDYDALIALSCPSNDFDFNFLARKFGNLWWVNPEDPPEKRIAYLSQADETVKPEGKALFLYRRADKQRIQIPEMDMRNSFMVQMDRYWKRNLESIYAGPQPDSTPIKRVEQTKPEVVIKQQKTEKPARLFTVKPSTEPTKHDELKLSGFLALFATLVFVFASRPLGLVPLLIVPLSYAASVALMFREVHTWIKTK